MGRLAHHAGLRRGSLLGRTALPRVPWRRGARWSARKPEVSEVRRKFRTRTNDLAPLRCGALCWVDRLRREPRPNATTTERQPRDPPLPSERGPAGGAPAPAAAPTTQASRISRTHAYGAHHEQELQAAARTDRGSRPEPRRRDGQSPTPLRGHCGTTARRAVLTMTGTTAVSASELRRRVREIEALHARTRELAAANVLATREAAAQAALAKQEADIAAREATAAALRLFGNDADLVAELLGIPAEDLEREAKPVTAARAKQVIESLRTRAERPRTRPVRTTRPTETRSPAATATARPTAAEPNDGRTDAG